MAKTTEKKSAKQEIIDIILEHMEKSNCLPWDKGLLNGQQLPINTTTGKRYQGINVLTLLAKGGGTHEYATFNQIKEKGGHVKKGAKGLPIVFYKPIEVEDKETGEKKTIPMLKKFTVFKLSDCEGIKGRRELKTLDNRKYPHIEEAVLRFFNVTNLGYSESSGTAFYSPGTHEIQISPINEYKNSESYYQTLFHEMIHSTMKAMGRDGEGAGFGSKVYSKEEVVAEFGSMLLCRAFGIEGESENSAEYVKAWSKKLRQNPDWLISGANKADKAVAYIIEKMGLTLDDNGIIEGAKVDDSKALPAPRKRENLPAVAAQGLPTMQLSLF